PDNRKIITMVAHTGYEQVAGELVKEIRQLTSDYDIEVLYDIATTGRQVVELRLQISHLIHCVGWEKYPVQLWEMPLPEGVPVEITTDTSETAAEVLMMYNKLK